MGADAAPTALPISFLSDYGLADEFVGICHAVIARRCPAARIIDIAHGIPRHNVLAGAITLRGAVEYLPAGVHLAVVDPAVGARGAGSRRAVALGTEHGGRLLVGPDNGLLMLAADRLGGPAEAVDIGGSPERLEPVSSTFHGRDVFAPVAAALADGASLRDVGEPVAASSLVRLAEPAARPHAGGLLARALLADRFGNLSTDATAAQLKALAGAAGALRIIGPGGSAAARLAGTFSDVAPGELVIYEDSQRMMALAVNEGSAAELLGAGAGDELTVLPR